MVEKRVESDLDTCAHIDVCVRAMSGAQRGSLIDKANYASINLSSDAIEFDLMMRTLKSGFCYHI